MSRGTQKSQSIGSNITIIIMLLAGVDQEIQYAEALAATTVTRAIFSLDCLHQLLCKYHVSCVYVITRRSMSPKELSSRKSVWPDIDSQLAICLRRQGQRYMQHLLYCKMSDHVVSSHTSREVEPRSSCLKAAYVCTSYIFEVLYLRLADLQDKPHVFTNNVTTQLCVQTCG